MREVSQKIRELEDQLDSFVNAYSKQANTMKKVAEELREGLDYQGHEKYWESWLVSLADELDPPELVAEADRKPDYSGGSL